MMKFYFTLLAAAFALVAWPAFAGDKVHHLAFQIDDDSADKMNLVLGNASNVAKYYSEKGEKIEIKVVAFNGGVNMMRTDKSPVLERLKSVTESVPNLTLEVCNNTLEGMAKREDKKVSEIPLFAGSKTVPAGVVELLELNEQGWTIIRP